jgi:AraC-like DNA-binding protein
MKRVLPGFSPLVRDARYCHVRPLRGRLAGPAVACAGNEQCLPQYRVSRPEFACWALEFIAEGEGTLELAGKTHRLRPGNAYVYGPGIAHEIHTDPKRPMRKYFVDFFGNATASFMDEIGLSPGELRRVAEPDNVRFLFDELIREGQKTGARHAEATDTYLRLLLYKAAELPVLGDTARSAAYATWRRCYRVLDERFCELKGLHELSRATGVNASHLCRLFKRFGNSTPHAELTRRKMNHAAALLLTTPELVKSIGIQVGYDDPLHFSRVFRRQFGCGPLAFQKAEARSA